MKPSPHLRLGVIGLLITGPAIPLVQARWEGPYSLTPPVPGAYSTSGPYGNWTATYDRNGSINTLNSPDQLILSTANPVLYGNYLAFTTHAAGNGSVSFSAVADSPGNCIFWWHPGGAGAPVYVPVDNVVPSGGYSFPVQAGDTFGFLFTDGTGFPFPDDLTPTITLVVTNFSAPSAPAVLASVGINSNQQFQFTLTGSTGAKYIIQTSTNLITPNWIPALTNIAPFLFTETNPPGAPQKFYRAIPLP